MSLDHVVTNYVPERIQNVRSNRLITRPYTPSFFDKIGSLFYKSSYFGSGLSHNISSGASIDMERHAKKYLENSKLENITVRFNHNSIREDVDRLLYDPKLSGMNKYIQIGVGVPTTIALGFLSKIFKFDYYNIFTRTATIYSNHEFCVYTRLAQAEIHSKKRSLFTGLLSTSRFTFPFLLGKAAHKAYNFSNKKNEIKKLTPGYVTLTFTPLAGMIATPAARLTGLMRRMFTEYKPV